MNSNVLTKVAILIGVATLVFQDFSTFASPFVSRPYCGLQFENLHKTIVWYNGANRMELTTKSACGYLATRVYDLSDATLTVQTAGRIIFKAHSKEARWADKQNNLLLNSPEYEISSPAVGAPPYLMVHLKKGEVTYPGGRLLLNSPVSGPSIH